MAKPSKFLQQLQAKHEQELHDTADLMTAWERQCCVDAFIITLGYGDCMGKDAWGKARIARFMEEWALEYKKVRYGISTNPDADEKRVKTDALLQKKVPAGRFEPWEIRYPMWPLTTLEQEADAYRAQWKRTGKLCRGSVTDRMMAEIQKANRPEIPEG